MIDLGTCIRHYKRDDVQQAIVEGALDKEVAPRFGDSFGKRPDIIKYPREILDLAQRGATSFHASEELWISPLRLDAGMSRQDLDEIRFGWDLVLDIDCTVLDYSKIAADQIVKVLTRHKISNTGLKYSGNKGFHIAVPFECFPSEVNSKPVKFNFPEAARIIATYIKSQIASTVTEQILEFENQKISNIIAKTGKPMTHPLRSDDPVKVINEKVFKYVEEIISLDTVLISSRHLYRMEYSLHEKSGLVSLPLDPSKVLDFSKDIADPKTFEMSRFKFLNRTAAQNQAALLFDQAYYLNMSTVQSQKASTSSRPAEFTADAIQINYFPPCIHKILGGMSDGRKRALFILINFLGSVGWDYKDIQNLVKDWNSKNQPPLNEVYIGGQLAYVKERKSRALPPNCHNAGYYSELGVKCSEDICNRCKNPVVYSKRLMAMNAEMDKKKPKAPKPSPKTSEG